MKAARETVESKCSLLYGATSSTFRSDDRRKESTTSVIHSTKRTNVGTSLPPHSENTSDIPDPSLEDITIEGMAFARSLISDLALDVLLYQSSYREHITEIVLNESNRIFRKFKERNPEFKDRKSVV